MMWLPDRYHCTIRRFFPFL